LFYRETVKGLYGIVKGITRGITVSERQEKVNILPGFLSNEDIEEILNKDIVVWPYNKKNLTDIGYNLTPTEFIFSINNGLLVQVHNNNNEKYCWIEPHDTVLIITREAVWVSEKISGTFHSKVKIVSQGFGHISTTLDAFWEGPLLISLNNPTKKRLKFVIGRDEGNGFEYCSFVTLIFYRMVTPTTKGHDNPSCRLDILKDIVSKPKAGIFYRNNEKYYELERLINKISNFETIKVDIGKANVEERSERIKQFQEKYSTFANRIDFYISQAHEINYQIIKAKRVMWYIGNIVWAIPIVGLGILLYNAYKDTNSNLIAVLVAMISFALTQYIKRFEKKENR
jgi:deoxycytidine triphosphate deaminase